MQRVVDRSHQVDELSVDDADDLLAGVERVENLLAHRINGDAVDEVLDDRIADVGLEQRLLHGVEPFAHIRLGQTGFARERA